MKVSDFLKKIATISGAEIQIEFRENKSDTEPDVESLNEYTTEEKSRSNYRAVGAIYAAGSRIRRKYRNYNGNQNSKTDAETKDRKAAERRKRGTETGDRGKRDPESRNNLDELSTGNSDVNYISS